jgi:hypothetical protein
MTSTIPAPTLAVEVDDWQEVNGGVCRYFHEADRPIPGVSGAYYSFTGRQRANGSITDREMYVEIPRDVISEAGVRSIIATLSAGLSDFLGGAVPGDTPTPATTKDCGSGEPFVRNGGLS